MATAMDELTVPRAEFESRCARTLDAARGRGLAGVLVWGRGGGPIDASADLLYLTDHYSPFPIIPDIEGHWAGRGYGAAVLSDRGVELIVDLPEVSRDDVYATEVRYSEDVIAGVIKALGEAGLSGGSVGLVGQDAMTARQWVALQGALPEIRLRPVDDIVHELRRVKSPAEQERIREACRIGVEVVDAMIAAVGTEKTEGDIVAAGIDIAVRRGVAVYNAFAETYGPRTSGRAGRHRMPTYSASHPLQEGDIFTIDTSGALDGYLYDFSRSRIIGPETPEYQRMISLARGAVLATVEGLVPGATVASAVAKGRRFLEESGYREGAGHFSALGHGLGLGWEDPWLLPDNDSVLEPGMYIAVEKAVSEGSYGASYEENVLITENGPDILTASAGRR